MSIAGKAGEIFIHRGNEIGREFLDGQGKSGKIFLQPGVVADQLPAPFGQRVRPAQTPRHAPERQFRPGNPLVGREYFVEDRCSQLLQARRQDGPLFFDKLVRPDKVIGKGDVGPGGPFAGQKVVIEKIDEDTAIKAIVQRQTQAAALEVEIALGESIDLAVQQQSLPNAGRISVIQRAFDKVPHEVADQQLRIASREIKVKEDIHPPPLISRALP